MLDEAGRRGVRLLCFGELFLAPFFPNRLEEDFAHYFMREDDPRPRRPAGEGARAAHRAGPALRRARRRGLLQHRARARRDGRGRRAATARRTSRRTFPTRRPAAPAATRSSTSRRATRCRCSTVAGTRVGIQICNDRLYPEASRALALAGARSHRDADLLLDLQRPRAPRVDLGGAAARARLRERRVRAGEQPRRRRGPAPPPGPQHGRRPARQHRRRGGHAGRPSSSSPRSTSTTSTAARAKFPWWRDRRPTCMARSSTPAEREPPWRRSSRAPRRARRQPLFVGSSPSASRCWRRSTPPAAPVALTELAALAQLERSAVQRITHTLKTLGYLRQHPQTRAFTIAGRMLDFGHTVLATDPVRAKAYAVPRAPERRHRRDGEPDGARGPRHRVRRALSERACGQRGPARGIAPAGVLHGRGARDPVRSCPSARRMARLAAAPRKAMTRAHGDRPAGLAARARRGAQARLCAERPGSVRRRHLGGGRRWSTAAAAVVGAINIAVPSPRWKIDDVRRKLAPKVVATAREIGAELGVREADPRG